MGNLEEMDKFLEKQKLLRLNQEEIERIMRDYYKQLENKEQKTPMLTE